MIDKIVWPEPAVSNAVAIKIEYRMIGPEISPAIETPFHITGPDILDLGFVGDKGIACQGIAFGTSGEMYAGLAALEPVVPDQIVMRVIDKQAFPACAAYQIPDQIRLVGVVQHQALVAIRKRQIIAHRDAVRIHQGKTKVIANRHIARDF